MLFVGSFWFVRLYDISSLIFFFFLIKSNQRQNLQDDIQLWFMIYLINKQTKTDIQTYSIAN